MRVIVQLVLWIGKLSTTLDSSIGKLRHGSALFLLYAISSQQSFMRFDSKRLRPRYRMSIL